MELLEENKSFGGWQRRYRHQSEVTQCAMTFSLYLPPQAETEKPPLIMWLSGLTCTDQNFVTKAGAQRHAAEHGVAICAPDTSPRGEDVPDDPEQAYDLGLGAGFYVDAVCAPWDRHYRMFRYINEELPALLAQHFPILDMSRIAISGHSMGGHGALVSALRLPTRYVSVSAFAPICAPSRCSWGEKAFSTYLGEDREKWKAYDATALIESGCQPCPIKIDQGSQDQFLEKQLLPGMLLKAASDRGMDVDYRLCDGYDHSYFFIATFVGDHIAFHAAQLNAS